MFLTDETKCEQIKNRKIFMQPEAEDYAMRAARRLIELAAARPGAALADVFGLALICLMVFAGFAMTSVA